MRLAAALVFLIFGIWALWFRRTLRSMGVFAALFLGVVVWFSSIQPSHDRPWRPEVALMPRAFIDGDRVRITGVRNFEYRSRDDFTVRYEEREVSLSHLNSLDFYVSYFWPESPVAHTFVSFVFDNAPPISISIETRPEIGEGFDPLPSLFKQFELIYVVGDERDLVRVRTNYRNEDVFLYRIRTSPEVVRRLFLVYLERINELADQARVLPSAQQQLHDQYRALCKPRRPGRPAGYPPHPERLERSLSLSTRASWMRACHLKNCAAVLISMRQRRLPETRRISPSAFANPCRQCPADLALSPYWTKVQYAGVKILGMCSPRKGIIHFSGRIPIRDLEERNQGNPDGDRWLQCSSELRFR